MFKSSTTVRGAFLQASLLLFLLSCTGGKEGFSGLEEKEAVKKLLSADVKPVKIEAWYPEDEMVFLAASKTRVFSLTLAEGHAKSIEVKFLLDGQPLQTSDRLFYELSGSELSPGPHELEVVVTDGVSKDSHKFSLVRNTPPQLGTASPSLGQTIEVDCTQPLQKFEVDVTDIDKDEVDIEWLYDGIISTSMITAFSKGSAQSFLPILCAEAGMHEVSIRASDGKDSVSAEWAVKITDPASTAAGPVHIIQYIPSDPIVVIRNGQSTTFAVNISAGAGPNVKYSFKLDSSVLVDKGTAPFLTLSGSSISAGAHTLLVTVQNEVNSATHTFNLRKNAPPAVTIVSPAITGTSVACGGGAVNFSATMTDTDNDTLTASWLLNGSPAPTLFSGSVSGSSVSSVFSPQCAQEGSALVGLSVTDGHDTTIVTWGIDIDNPNVATINSVSPTASPVVITSAGSQVFTVNGTGKVPLVYEWRLNGVLINGASSATLTLNGVDLTTGDHTLQVKLKDSNSEDTHDFIIRRNGPPVLANIAPAASSLKINHQVVQPFSVDASDGNSGDTISYTWTLNNVPSAYLTSSNTGSGSTASFEPDNTLIGTHTIKVRVTDGVEAVEHSWQVVVNYFTTACNNLAGGRVCTLAGPSHLGHGADISVVGNQNVRINPEAMTNDGSNNVFFTDSGTHSVSFYNRSNTAVTRLGINMPPHTMVLIAGNGAIGSSADDISRSEVQMGANPRGIAYDATRDVLYISDYNNHRVLRIDSSGIMRHVFGTGANTSNAGTNTEGGVGTSSVCANPTNLIVRPATDDVIVACYTTNAIKRFTNASGDPGSIQGYTLVGQHSAGIPQSGTTDGAYGTAGAARITGPWGLTLGPDGNLYFTEYGGSCKVRVLNFTGSAINYFNGAVTAPANQVKSLFGNSCNTAHGAVAAINVNQPQAIAVLSDGSTGVRGIFVSNTTGARVIFVNNTASPISLGGETVAVGQGAAVIGTGTADFNGDGYLGKDSFLNLPRGLALMDSEVRLLVADRSNGRIRTLELDPGNTASTLLGNGLGLAGFNGDAAAPAPDTLFGETTHVAYHNNKLYVSDRTNFRVRVINLLTGTVLTGAGKGSGAAGEGAASDVFTQGPMGLSIADNVLYFVDNQGGGGTSRNCQVRGWNLSGSDVTRFNRTIVGGFVSSIVGNYALGCASWVPGSHEGASALNVPLHLPEDVAIVNGEMYVSNYNVHCLLKVNSSGIVSRFLGTCGTTGNVDNVTLASDSARIRYPRSIAPDPRHPGNFFFSDQTDQGTSRIKYVNQGATTVTIGGIDVLAGYVRTVYVVSDRDLNGLAMFDKQVCYASGTNANGATGAHHVVCKDRDAMFDSTSLQVGASFSVMPRAAGPYNSTHEGEVAAMVRLYAPWGITFDDVGNLYIAERSGRRIRMVKKWWN